MSNLLSLPEVPSPKLIPVLTFNLKLKSDPKLIYTNTIIDNTLNLATITEGEIRAIEGNELGFKFQINDIFGTDDLNIKPSINTAYLDCKLYGKSPNGSGVKIIYGGKVQLNKASIDVLDGSSSSASIAESYVTCNPNFIFDDSIEEEFKWVLKENLIGKGRFARDNDNNLYVQYYIYVIR
ncbi:uncharacterized protein KGF55_000581 [Candida pseudojiufengensis]|uniref:uncharacterized protein n=1 Tax=Candida pseudojiufengensis TaxID=497109 RepID=UPI00222541D9|nr:uncharacterized protein KGF55_000581 [Candida pseudojiufengensis]KAI5966272.1 hypothetical protein KGF55_000581 [Candida pseudojiufengensis]